MTTSDDLLDEIEELRTLVAILEDHILELEGLIDQQKEYRERKLKEYRAEIRRLKGESV